jgi:hypothetical protein
MLNDIFIFIFNVSIPFPLKDINTYVLFKEIKFVTFFPHMVVFRMVKITIFSRMSWDQKYFLSEHQAQIDFG